MEKGPEGRSEIKKIAIVGPESTGKSSLSKALAKHYHTQWVPEFAREYLEKIQRPYTRDDLSRIARGQTRLEDQYIKKARKILISDTNLLVIKIWSEHKYGECDPWILEQIRERKYHLHLLTGIDIPWEEDPQREHPHMRAYFYDVYYQELQQQELDFREINGNMNERLSTAIRAIDALQKDNN